MNIAKSIFFGITAGLVAGLVFTSFFLMSGMAEAVGSMIGLPNKLGGLIAHTLISIAGGVIFALLLGQLIHSWTTSIIWGILFGVALWLIGPMTLLPYILTNTPIFSKWTLIDLQANIPMFIGHVIYGAVLGIIFYALESPHKQKRF